MAAQAAIHVSFSKFLGWAAIVFNEAIIETCADGRLRGHDDKQSAASGAAIMLVQQVAVTKREVGDMEQPQWLATAWAELGQREVAGAADNARIRAFFRDVGHPPSLHDEVAWCAAFAGACLERAGMPRRAR